VRVVRLLLISLSLVIVLAACGGGEPPEDTVSELVEALSASDYAAAYDLLHPKHQAVVSEQLFEECGRDAEQISSARVDDFTITGEVERDRDITELGEVKVTEVGVNLVQRGETTYRTWDVVKDDGEWRWLLANDLLEDFRAGRCPGEAASAQP
jgi:hypothetical protein